MTAHHRAAKWLPTALAVLAVLMLAGGLVLLGVRDGRAEDRCGALGGQTWDAGKHCVLGDPRIVSTR